MPRHNIVSWAATQKRPQWLQFKALAEHLWIPGSNEIGCAAVGLFKWCSQKGLQQYVKRCVAMYHFCNVWTTLQTINCPLDKNNTNTSLRLMRREPSKAWFVKLILMWHSFSESSLLGTSELMEAAPTVFELSPSDIQKAAAERDLLLSWLDSFAPFRSLPSAKHHGTELAGPDPQSPSHLVKKVS